MSINIPKGTGFALAACFIWGLDFVVPLFMEGFSTIEIALGCYLTYGLLSFLIFSKKFLEGKFRYPSAIWMKALKFALICSIGYYMLVILSLRYATPAICTLILGVSPITIAFYGNWKQKEIRYRSLILPSLLIFLGLIAINIPNVMNSSSPSTYFLGLFCGVWALGVWSYYVVTNAAFLKNNPQLDSKDWSTLIGVCNLFWVLILGSSLIIFFSDHLNLQRYLVLDPQITNFIIGCCIFGLVFSWLGAYFWNKASVYLPISLAGQLTIFETLFGISFVYMLEQRFPHKLEFLGIAFLLAAIIYGIRISAQAIKAKAVN